MKHDEGKLESSMTTTEMARLAKVLFDHEGWSWYDTDGQPPSVDRIGETIARLLKSASRRDVVSVSSGRLRVDVSDNGDGRQVEYIVSLELGSV